MQIVSKLWAGRQRADTIQRWRRFLLWHMKEVRERISDRFHNIDTFGPALDDLHDQRWPHAYGSAPWSVPLKALKPLDLDHSQFTFVDIGSGKGRVVLAASTLPFARVIGVEFSPPLCRIAERNLVTSRYVRRRAGQVGIVETNATAFAVPDTPCVYYFYNPLSFDLLEIVINDIVKSYRTDRREIYLLCVGMSSIIQKIMAHPNLQILHEFEVKTDLSSKASVFILMVADD